MNDKISEKINELVVKSKGIKVLEDLVKYVRALEKDKDVAWKNYHKLRDEYNKDEEIAKLKQTIEDMRKKSFLTLDDVELEAYTKFTTKHYESCYKRKRGTTHVEFFGTGLGNVITVKCSVCDAIEDITNIDNW
jgi:hypothetical protein